MTGEESPAFGSNKSTLASTGAFDFIRVHLRASAAKLPFPPHLPAISIITRQTQPPPHFSFPRILPFKFNNITTQPQTPSRIIFTYESHRPKARRQPRQRPQ